MAKVSKVHDISKEQSPEGRSGPLQELDNMFNQFIRRPWLHPLAGEWPVFRSLGWKFEEPLPPVDVIDRDTEILLRAQLPGLRKDQLEVSVTETTVTIKGSARTEEKEEKEHYYRSEISSGSFARTVSLPGRIATDQVKARYTDGVLELTLPKQEKTTRRSVDID